MALSDYLQLAMTPGLGPITIARLVENLGSSQRAASASIAELRRIDGIGSIKADSIIQGRQSAIENALKEIEKARQLGINLICPDDENYPPLLRSIGDAPSVLYIKGSIEPRDLHAVAIVGSRKCSFYGREQAERFASLLAGAGITIVSGGARGIDSAAHRGALAQPAGRTLAVLGSGIDVPYPPENDSLFNQIAAHGAVISEYSFGTPPTPENFPRRNRIISGLARAVLVVEADERSGALITARLAADDQNRPVLAIPGRVDNPLSAGPHKLIRDGAILASKLEDILEALGPLPDHVRQITSPTLTAQPSSAEDLLATVSDSQKTLLLNLGRDPTHVDSLIDLTSLPAEQVLQDLTLLTLRGLVKRIDGQHYVRK